MEGIRHPRSGSRRGTLVLVLTILAWESVAKDAGAASWNGIEPFKSRRDEVVKVLGKPIGESSEGALRFAVSGGTVLVSFVSEEFVTSKKLRPELAGRLSAIAVQHQHDYVKPVSFHFIQRKDG